jgi:hypothetical protein
MEVGECGVCGSWRRGDLFPSENKREDGTTTDENFVCARCQRDVREWREIERAIDEYGKRRRRLQAGSVARAKGLPA